MNACNGRIHSTYMGGMVDGPGIRYVLFLAGCEMRCKFCHNPDTWDMDAGKLMSADEILYDMEKYRSYVEISGGGVTVTGGEPLGQAEFLIEFFAACKQKNWHTALQTAGYSQASGADDSLRRVLTHTDLVLLDLKAFDDARHRQLTGVSNRRIFDFLRLCEQMKKRVHIRYVLVPNLTDDKIDIIRLGEFLRGFECIEKTDVLPFHKNGEHKWRELGLKYELYDTPAPEVGEVERASGILQGKINSLT